MAKRAIEHLFSGSTTSYSISGIGYNPALVNKGSLITQTGGWAGPLPIALGRPMEASTPIPVFMPVAIRFDNNIDWLFTIENSAAAAAARRVVMYTYNRTTSSLTWIGFITLTLNNATAHTIRGFRMNRLLYTTGTAASNGTAVTGTSTTWVNDRLSVGSRIGFGNTDPTKITTWYFISAIGTNTGITISNPTGVIADGPYVIEELQAIVATTNATTTNGGIFMGKGINISDFTTGGTTISAAVATDKVKAVYWLREGLSTNQIACGIALQPRDSWSAQNLYCIDGTTSPRVLKYNIRESLTGLVIGSSSAAWTLSTATQLATGTLTQTNNGRFGDVNHGTYSGSGGLFFVTNSRVYFALTGNITLNNATWFTANMTEIPPGGTSTIMATGLMSCVEVADSIDRLIITTTGGTGVKSYVSMFRTDTTQMDRLFLNQDMFLDQSLASTGVPVHPSIQASVMYPWAEEGILYLVRGQVSAALNQIYAMPLGADWEFAGNTGNLQYLITPELSTPNCNKYSRVYVARDKIIGDDNFGLPTEPFSLHYRTTGINNDSGVWTRVDDTGDLSGVDGSSSIQFMFKFKTIGQFCIPSRIYSVGLVYEDTTTDSHFQPSVGQSSLTGKRFSWRFSTAFGSTVPTLYLKLYDSVLGTLLLQDSTVSLSAGSFEKSIDGGSNWSTTGLTADKVNDVTYLRYTPTSLGDNIRVRALLTQ